MTPTQNTAHVCTHRPWFPQARGALKPTCQAPCPERHRRFVLGATILGSSMAFIDGTVVNLALPAIQRSFQIEFDLLQWVVNAYTLLLGALILTGGALGDRYGRRRVYVAGVGLFAVSSIACALATTASWLIAARAVQGIGAALLVPQSLAIIAASFPKDGRGRAIGIWAAAAAITTAAGPIVGGAFIEWFSWRAVFWINIPLAAITVVLALGFVPESRGDSSGRLDWAGSVLATSGLALLVYAVTAIAERGFLDPAVLGCLGASVALLAVFLWTETRARTPIMPLDVFRSTTFSVANTVTLCLYFALSGVLFLLPYNLIEVHGYSSLEVGAALLPFGIIMALFSSRAGGLADRHGPRIFLALGSMLVAVACLVLVFSEAGRDLGYWLGFFPAILLLAIGMTLCVAPLTTVVLNAVADKETGVASGINNALSRLAGVFAVALVGLTASLVFTNELADHIAGMELANEAREQLLSNAQQLAGLDVPRTVGAEMTALVQNAITSAFQSGYRLGMIVAAASASAAAGFAWWGGVKS